MNHLLYDTHGQQTAPESEGRPYYEPPTKCPLCLEDSEDGEVCNECKEYEAEEKRYAENNQQKICGALHQTFAK